MYFLLHYLIIFIIYNTCFSLILSRNTFKTSSDDNSDNNSRNHYIKSYAGIGFDLIIGNPYDNFTDLNTFGFRSTIIGPYIVTLDKSGNPRVEGNSSIWIRKVSNCYQNYQPHYLDKGDDVVQELFNDFSLDTPLSEDLWQRNVNGLDISKILNKDSKFKIIKCYCGLYESGLILPYNGLLSEDFSNAINKLPEKVESDQECPLDIFITEPENDKCKNLRVWINFFRTFGTHITTYVLIGGKFINMETYVNIQMDDKENNSNSKQNVQTSDIFKRKIKGTKLKKHLWVIGGSFVKGLEDINSKTFSRWVRTIPSRPMPIKSKFSMLSIFFPEKHETYLNSIEYYSELIGISRETPIEEATIEELFVRGKSMSTFERFVMCPSNTTVTSGLILKKNGKEFDIETCKESSSTCSIDPSTTGSIWVLCNEPTLKEVITVSSEKGECPVNGVIFIGFCIRRKDENYEIVTCEMGVLIIEDFKIGKKNCGIDPNGFKCWLICTKERLIDKTLVVKSQVSLKGESKRIKCDENHSMINGISLRIRETPFTKNADSSVKVCRYSRECETDCSIFTCVTAYSLIICKHD